MNSEKLWKIFIKKNTNTFHYSLFTKKKHLETGVFSFIDLIHDICIYYNINKKQKHMKKTTLMVFSKQTLSEVMAECLRSSFHMDVTLVHSLQECLNLYKDFDILIIETDFSLTENKNILLDNEQVEQMLDVPFPVFNLLKKIQHDTIIVYTLFTEKIVLDKLEEMNLSVNSVVCGANTSRLAEMIKKVMEQEQKEEVICM